MHYLGFLDSYPLHAAAGSTTFYASFATDAPLFSTFDLAVFALASTALALQA
uniref:Uncharacterized protein n=2 Tax=Picea TaxID=3328 RepID=A0A101LWF7_PICGL|nr:hypothetical protein ABT39_MTgene1304 [Picea glauca]QHR89798.1 hypothetical protein Q903MT_gene3820 [Picea sitchensis]